MGPKRRAFHLNRVLRNNLGENPLHAWLNTDDEELQHPMQVFREAIQPDNTLGWEPVYDYVCGCGKNVTIHSPDCGQISRAIARMRIESALPDHPHKWVLCYRATVTPRAFIDVVGHDEHFRPHWWMPLGIEGFPPPGYFILRGEPNERATQAAVALITEYRGMKPAQWAYERRRQRTRRDQRIEDRAIDMARECLGVTLTPGQKGEVSFPSVGI